MRCTVKQLLSFALSLLLCLSLVACGSCTGDPEIPPLSLTRTEDGAFRDEENGITYRRAPDAYIPNRMLRRVYATCRYTAPAGGEANLSFFAIGEDSAQRYLVYADPEDFYPYYMIVADGQALLPLSGLDASIIVICGTDEEFFWQTANVYDYVRTQAKIDTVLSAFLLGSDTELPAGQPLRSVFLLFSSETNTDYSYYITYLEYGPGRTYLHDPSTDHTVLVDDALLDGYRLSFEDDAD